jgi:hypothetical protein
MVNAMAMMEHDSLKPWQRRAPLNSSEGRARENMKQVLKNMICGSKNLTFTEKGLLALAGPQDTTVLECLLSEPRLRDQVRIPPNMVKVAATSKSGSKATEILLRERRNEIRIDERVILAALSNKWHVKHLAIMEVIFRRRAGEVRVTERLLEIVAGGKSCAKPKLLNLFLNHVGDYFLVTTKMVEMLF